MRPCIEVSTAPWMMLRSAAECCGGGVYSEDCRTVWVEIEDTIRTVRTQWNTECADRRYTDTDTHTDSNYSVSSLFSLFSLVSPTAVSTRIHPIPSRAIALNWVRPLSYRLVPLLFALLLYRNSGCSFISWSSHRELPVLCFFLHRHSPSRPPHPTSPFPRRCSCPTAASLPPLQSRHAEDLESLPRHSNHGRTSSTGPAGIGGGSVYPSRLRRACRMSPPARHVSSTAIY